MNIQTKEAAIRITSPAFELIRKKGGHVTLFVGAGPSQNSC